MRWSREKASLARMHRLAQFPLVLLGLFWIGTATLAFDQQPTVPPVEADTTPDFLQPIEEMSETDWKLEQRGAEVLRKLTKNLIMDQTRGEKEVALYQAAAPAVVFVLGNVGTGTGTLVDSDGHVLTNWHVVGNDRHVLIFFKPETSEELMNRDLAFRATVEKVDKQKDLALLRITRTPRSFAHLLLGELADLRVGQDVHVIGHPEGEVWTYTKGVISQISELPPIGWTVFDLN